MTEEEKKEDELPKEEEAEEAEEEDSSSEDKPKDKVTEALEAAKRIEEANKKTEELVARQEKIAATNILGGKSEAGKVEEKKEETPTEYKDRILRGEIEKK